MALSVSGGVSTAPAMVNQCPRRPSRVMLAPSAQLTRDLHLSDSRDVRSSRCRIHVALVNVSSCMQSATASFHSARVIPKRPRNRSPAKREFFGLTAGCGNSELAIGVTLGFFQLTSCLPVTSSKMVSAKPHQLVEPPAVRLRIPDVKSAWPRCEQARSMMSDVAVAMWRAYLPR